MAYPNNPNEVNHPEIGTNRAENEASVAPEAVAPPVDVNTPAESVRSAEFESKPPKKHNRKLLVRLLLIAAALLLIVGGIFGIILIKNHLRAMEITDQLIGKTFEYHIDYYFLDSYMTEWLTFKEDGICHEEYYHAPIYDENSDSEVYNEIDWDYAVKVALNGDISLEIGIYTYEIEFDSSGDIEKLTDDFDNEYSVIDRDSDRSLKDTADEQNQAKARLENKNTALQLFSNIRLWDISSETVGSLIPIVFKDYTTSVEPEGDSDTVFLVTVSGTYFPNTDVPQYTEEGSMTCRIDVENQTYEITHGQNVKSAMETYVALHTVWW